MSRCASALFILTILMTSRAQALTRCEVRGDASSWAYDACLWRYSTDDAGNPAVLACAEQNYRVIKHYGTCKAKRIFKDRICTAMGGGSDTKACMAQDQALGPQVRGEIDIMDACSKGDHVEQRDCLSETAEAVERHVHETVKLLRQKIQVWDKEEPEVTADLLSHFEASEASYARYRQEQCEFDAAVAVGGNGAGDMRFLCLIKLDNEHLKLLQERLRWFDSPE